MCRSIKTLRRPGQVAAEEEIVSAATQYVRKVSGYHRPSTANQEAFDAAVRDVADASRKLLASLRPGARAARPEGSAATRSAGA